MFRNMPGFRTNYGELTLLVVSEFNEWRVVLHGPAGIIQGARQFSETKAKEHAVEIAKHFLADHGRGPAPETAAVQWGPTAPEDYQIWS